MFSRLCTILLSFARIPRSLTEQAEAQRRMQAALVEQSEALTARLTQDLSERLTQSVAQSVSERLNARLAADSELINYRLVLALNDISLMAGRQLEFQRETRLVLGQMTQPARALWTKPWIPDADAAQTARFSHTTVCRQADMATGLYPYWMQKIGFGPIWHRKRWEFMYICQALHERGLLRPGMRGLGFGVGAEPLTAYFASEGCHVTGTDMAPEAAAQSGWVETAQHARSREALRRPFVCPDPVFDANVSFRFCDMNHIPEDLGGYDFCWSACALEHLGSIKQGLAFIERSVDCLKPGGVAVHTTEYNLSSNEETVSEGSTVLFRRRDMEALSTRLAAKGHVMTPLDVEPGEDVLDQYLDLPPYLDEPHLKLALQGYAATSLGLIVRKGPA